jgi:hypothetical protein
MTGVAVSPHPRFATDRAETCRKGFIIATEGVRHGGTAPERVS